MQVCRAVQHAHQKGIIHRDLKPSNILVTLHDGVPVPKVIDFGIAKATEGRLTNATVYTEFHQIIGTPAYMSPEQAEMSGLDIDTRTDIYSLGMLLYELLTGRTPFDPNELMADGLDAMRKTIREKDPVRPSTKLATLNGDELTTTAKRRSVEVAKLARLLHGDLDWIVMKCLEKDRTRRYETANGLAMDIRRHLANEPIIARPPSKLYEFQKTVRRHKVGFAATAAVILVLAVGVILTAWQAVRATNAKREALAAREQTQKALYDSLIDQARATRLARRPGYRARVFALLKQAKALEVPQKNLDDLRGEAVACLGDFVGLTPTILTNFPAELSGRACLAPSGQLAAFALTDGTIQLCQMPSGEAVARLPGSHGAFDQLCFNSTGDRLFASIGPQTDNHQNLLSSLPKCRVCSWARDLQDRWQPASDQALSGAWQLFNHGPETFASVLEMSAFEPGASQERHAKFRLFNLRSGAYVAGYEVTTTLPEQFRLATSSRFVDPTSFHRAGSRSANAPPRQDETCASDTFLLVTPATAFPSSPGQTRSGPSRPNRPTSRLRRRARNCRHSGRRVRLGLERRLPRRCVRHCN